MALRRTPLAPRNAEFPLGKMKTQKAPKSLVPPIDRADLLTLLMKINDSFCDPAVQVKITERDLTHPTSERVEVIYLMLLNVMFNIMPSSLNQMPFSTTVTYPELYDGTHYVLNFVRLIQCVLDSCALPEHDFSPHDLSDPSPKRTHYYFTAIVNYIKFTQYINKECCTDEYVNKTTKGTEQLQDLNGKNMELSEVIQHLRRQKVEEKPVEDKLKEDILVAEQNSQELHDCQIQGEEKLKNCEQSNESAHNRLELVNKEFMSVHSRLEELKLQVVGSPEELEKKLETVKEELDEIKSVHEDCLANHNMWERLCAIADNSLPSVNSIKDDVSELIDKASTLNLKVLELEKCKDTILKWRRSYKELLAKQQNLVRHFKIIQEEIGRLEMTNYSNLGNEELKKEVIALQQKVEEKTACDQKIAEQILEMESKLKKIHEQLKLVTDEYKATVKILQELTEQYIAKTKSIEEKIMKNVVT